MRNYELMLVFAPDVDVKDEKHFAEIVGKLVAGENVVVQGVTVMGKKALAYPIEKQTEGVYVMAKIQAKALRADEIEKRVKLGVRVLRYLLTVEE